MDSDTLDLTSASGTGIRRTPLLKPSLSRRTVVSPTGHWEVGSGNSSGGKRRQANGVDTQWSGVLDQTLRVKADGRREERRDVSER